jgi:hypothetical protein
VHDRAHVASFDELELLAMDPDFDQDVVGVLPTASEGRGFATVPLRLARLVLISLVLTLGVPDKALCWGCSLEKTFRSDGSLLSPGTRQGALRVVQALHFIFFLVLWFLFCYFFVLPDLTFYLT